VSRHVVEAVAGAEVPLEDPQRQRGYSPGA